MGGGEPRVVPLCHLTTPLIKTLTSVLTGQFGCSVEKGLKKRNGINRAGKKQGELLQLPGRGKVWARVRVAAYIVGRSQNGSDSGCILKVDLTGFFHGIGVGEKKSYQA